MRLVATSIIALEVYFLKLKPLILTGIAGGLYTLKRQSERTTAQAAVLSNRNIVIYVIIQCSLAGMNLYA